MANRRSQAVPLVLVQGVAAAALSMGCGSSPRGNQRVCVDNGRTVVDQQQCVGDEQRGRGASGSFTPGPSGGGGGYVPMYHWYYYPSGTRLPLLGSIAPNTGSPFAPGTTGTTTPGVGSSTTTSSSPSGVVRGGLGSTGSGSVGA